MRRWSIHCRITLAALLVLVYSGVPDLASAEPYVHPDTQLVFPDVVAGMRRAGLQNYEAEQRGLGISVRYQSQPEVHADVYIYNAGLKAVPATVRDPLFGQLRQATRRDIVANIEKTGVGVRPGESRTVTVDTAKGSVEVLFDSFVAVFPNDVQNTFVWNWPARNHFFKIRVTRKAGDHDPRAVREFFETFVRLSVE